MNKVAVVLLGMGFVAARPLTGQVRLEFTPVVGAYVPTEPVGPSGPIQCTAIDTSPAYFASRQAGHGGTAQAPVISGSGPVGCGTVVRQQTGLNFGGRLTAWVGQRFALELSVDAGLGVAANYPLGNGELTDVSAHLIAGSLRVVGNLLPRASRVSPFVVAGGGFVDHGGPAYSDLTAARTYLAGSAPSNTAWGPVFGAGLLFRLEGDNVLRAEIDDYRYEFSGEVGYALGPAVYGQQTQNDVVVTLGFAIHLASAR